MSLVSSVEIDGDFESEADARAATRATLETLGERLGRGEAMDIADFLGPDPTAWLTEDQDVEAADFDIEEFVERVAEREGVDNQTAHHHAQIVFDVLEATVPADELDRAANQLPRAYDTLLP